MKFFDRIYLLLLFSASLLFSQELPFHKGVNITNWFQADSPQQIQFSKYTKTDFEQIKSLGADAIRLPINLHSMTDGSPNYKLDSLFLNFLDKVVDWAEELEMHLIIDNHTFDVTASTSTNIDEVLLPVWQNMAKHLKDRSTLIYFEILNEPHGISDKRWNEIQLKVVNRIREIDTVHTIVVGPANWNSYNNLTAMPEYPNDNLIYTFHFYDPFIFTHQGASWTSPSMVSLSGVPFPYNASSMPEIPDDLLNTWIASNMKSTYPREGNVIKVKEFLDIAKKFKEQRNAILWCGEFGVYRNNSDNDDRVFWYQTVREYLEELGIAWTIWDYKGGFGIFEKDTDELFESDLNIPLVEALGFEVPEQTEPEILPDEEAVPIYLDYLENGINNSSNTGSSTTDFYNTNDPRQGEYSIYWTGAAQYNNIGFNFTPDRDLTYLVDNGFAIEFYVKMQGDFKSFDVRFIDTKTNVAEDHPWRIRYTVTEEDLIADGTWQKLSIKLDEMIDAGSWDNNQWYNAVTGAFDWALVDKLEFTAENEAINDTKIWLDDINIQDPLVSVKDNNQEISKFQLLQNYPNPFNPTTKIQYSIPTLGDAKFASPTNVKLMVFDLLGREVAVLVNEYQRPGKYAVSFDGNNLPSGIYFFSLSAGEFYDAKKMILLK